MKRTTLGTILFAALFGVTAHGQIITNYGPNTYNTIPDINPNGSWNGTTGNLIGPTGNASSVSAQTFVAPSTTLFAYNIQLNVTGLLSPATFSIGIYSWNPTAPTSSLGDSNNFKGTIGSLVAGSDNTFSVSSAGFNPYGNNFVTGGITLSPGAIYAIVLTRTDSNSGGTVQYGYDTTGGNYVDGFGDPALTDGSAGDYVQGGLYTFQGAPSGSNVLGTNFTRSGGTGAQDMAFWMSFQAESLSPVPEPAVNGAIVGVMVVAGLMAWRRYGRKSAEPSATTV